MFETRLYLWPNFSDLLFSIFNLYTSNLASIIYKPNVSQHPFPENYTVSNDWLILHAIIKT